MGLSSRLALEYMPTQDCILKCPSRSYSAAGGYQANLYILWPPSGHARPCPQQWRLNWQRQPWHQMLSCPYGEPALWPGQRHQGSLLLPCWCQKWLNGCCALTLAHSVCLHKAHLY